MFMYQVPMLFSLTFSYEIIVYRQNILDIYTTIPLLSNSSATGSAMGSYSVENAYDEHDFFRTKGDLGALGYTINSH
ncbi:hypothetical protein HanPSC8_Chr12g0534231 [Helianthus annuus]|nr:hypothetical protein HanPSC8_Chr12g0534231 [Helianthus annuus]